MSEINAFLAEDDEDTQAVVSRLLGDLGCRVRAFGSGADCWAHLETAPRPDLLLLDIQLPGMSGLEIFRRSHHLHPSLPVILLTGFGDTDQAVQAILGGAYYYFSKPLDLFLVRRTLATLIENLRLQRQLEALAPAASELVGRSGSLRKALEKIDMVAELPLPVLIGGETGTGKELVARAIHKKSPRSGGPFIAINCAALPENLLESELFGYEKGAFTGAVQSKPGRFEAAQGGTLLLDEIGELPLALQAKLLRVLETRELERLGSVRQRTLDVRFLASTNRELAGMVEAGGFRRDLYFRLNAVQIVLPPLRERMEDLPLLIQHFVFQFNRQYGRHVQTIDPGVYRALSEYDWPGNIRELKHMVEAAVALCAGSSLGLEHFPLQPALPATSGDSVLWSMESRTLRRALEECGGNRTLAARSLGITRSRLRRKIKKYGLA